MSLTKSAVLAALAAAILPAQLAAQTPSTPTATETAEPRPIGKVSLNTLNLGAATAAFQAARQPLPMRGFFIKAHVGAWTSNGSGLTLGAGIGALPFDSDQHEITGNASYLRVEGINGFMIDANYLYNFRLEGGQAFTPYAGGGINFSRFSFNACGDFEDELEDAGLDCDLSDSDTALQIGGGVKKPFGTAGREVFGEVFFVLSDGGPIILRGGINF
jgi:opacity protein-like surface antigen